jgi:hypothetical protein
MSRASRDIWIKGRKLGFKLLVGASVLTLIFIAVGAIKSLEDNPLELISESYNCLKEVCSYRISVKNNSPDEVLAFARVTGFEFAGAKNRSLVQAGSERVEFSIKGAEVKVLRGKFHSELGIDSLRFYVGTAKKI